MSDLEVLRAGREDSSPVEQPPADLIIDTDRSEPAASAGTIIQVFGLRPERPVIAFPA
ncbi:hypothetical protein GCM10027613_38030 [Microlunatus endophyticus]